MPARPAQARAAGLSVTSFVALVVAVQVLLAVAVNFTMTDVGCQIDFSVAAVVRPSVRPATYLQITFRFAMPKRFRRVGRSRDIITRHSPGMNMTYMPTRNSAMCQLHYSTLDKCRRRPYRTAVGRVVVTESLVSMEIALRKEAPAPSLVLQSPSPQMDQEYPKSREHFPGLFVKGMIERSITQ